ncbi:MAG: 5-formyltetrahydrofolate cyclo-ligase [Francisellaceae bacterium]|nr:5-formyltetrahydrofolate cyclo-ligase [Francisellaceae bacterium]
MFLNSTLKKILRRYYIKKRQAYKNTSFTHISSQIQTQFFNLEIFHSSQHIAGFYPVNGEVDCLTLLNLAHQLNKNCYLPKIDILNKNNLCFIEYRPGDPLKKNQFGILEPDLKDRKKILSQDLDLVLMPLVAFDGKGNRLGMGKGYYDYTFSFLLNKPLIKFPKLIGLAYEFQKILRLPNEPWDIPMAGIITESKYREFTAN